ncbi:MAG: hypothetical protein GKR88_15605 [Flavobacteriaceae bacterium]|nr:MAG: hypothetical protein GKR88_15605 [Flavobacteriaceae bacterium]
MDVFYELIPILDIFFTGICIFLTLYLGIKGIYKKSVFNLVIAAGLFNFAIDFIISVLEGEGKSFIFPNVYKITILILLMYTHFLANQKITLKLILISILGFIGLITYFIIPDDIPESIDVVIWIITMVIDISLLCVALANLTSYQNQIKRYYSSISKKSLHGLRLVIYIFIFFCATYLIGEISFSYMEVTGSEIIPSSYTYFSIVYLGVFALNNQFHLLELSTVFKELKQVRLENVGMNNAVDTFFF